MIIFTIIAIVIIFFLWFNTSVFDYKRAYEGYNHKWRIDRDSERRLPITLCRVIGLVLLLIPWWNIGIFSLYLIWYIKRAVRPDENRECIIYELNVEKYSPFICNTFSFIEKILNKRII